MHQAALTDLTGWNPVPEVREHGRGAFGEDGVSRLPETVAHQLQAPGKKLKLKERMI